MDMPAFPVLDILPTDVLMLIFDYLSPRTLFYTVRVVCKRFAALLARDNYFKVRFRKRYLKDEIEFPLLTYYGLNEEDSRSWRRGKEISWTDITVRTDTRENIFGFNSKNFRHTTHCLPHTTTVDAVHLLKDGRICVSGGRDRLLCLWDINQSLIAHNNEAHEGWIWDIKGHDQDSFFTCGWDTTIKQWALHSGIQFVQGLRTERAMCLSSEPGLLAAGIQNGKIVLMDTRIGNQSEYYEKKLHRGAVTGIKIWGNQILSIGEDRKMGVLDIRNLDDIIAHRHVNCVIKTCPRSIGVYKDLLYIGDSRGYLNIFDIKSDFNPVLCSKVGEGRAINALIPSLEGIIIGTSDVGLRFVIPSSPLRIIGQYDLLGEVTSIDFKNHTLVAGCSNSMKCVHFLRANDHISNLMNPWGNLNVDLRHI